MQEVATASNGMQVIPMSETARLTLNPIRLLLDKGALVPNPSLKTIKLSIGDPTLDGEYRPPENVIHALHRVIDERMHNGYAPAFGNQQARRAVSEKYAFSGNQLTENDVVLCSGCSGALDIAIRVLCNPGDALLIPKPGFVLYQTICVSSKIECPMYALRPDRDWEVDIADLESKITPATKAILVNNPSNPCGSVYTEKHLEQIVDVASRHGLPIVADEIYADMCFGTTRFVSLAEVAYRKGARVPVLVCGGLAKRYVVPGWRLGWVVAFDHGTGVFASIKEGMQRMAMLLLGPCALIQGVIHSALFDTPPSYALEMNQKLERAATVCYTALCGVVGLSPSMPQGTMYMMVGIHLDSFQDIYDDVDFYAKLVEEQSVYVLPLSTFHCPGFFRLVFTSSEHLLKEACDRIRLFCEAHKKLM